MIEGDPGEAYGCTGCAARGATRRGWRVLCWEICNGAQLVSLPIILLYLPMQKMFMQGLTSGAVKG